MIQCARVFCHAFPICFKNGPNESVNYESNLAIKMTKNEMVQNRLHTSDEIDPQSFIGQASPTFDLKN